MNYCVQMMIQLVVNADDENEAIAEAEEQVTAFVDDYDFTQVLSIMEVGDEE